MQELATQIRDKQQRNLPDQIVDLFIALIFIGDLKAGDRLPPELKLTKILKVNQSSLRMAMRVLTRMGAIKSTRGSGLVVQDYQLHAELNFMTELVRIPELQLGSNFLIKVLDSSPAMLGHLMRSVTDADPDIVSVPYLTVLEQQIKLLQEKQSPHKIAELDIFIQNAASSAIDNPILRATFNSFSPLRNHLMELYYSIDGDHLSHVENQKAIWIAYMKSEISQEEFNRKYLALINDEAQVLRDYLVTLPEAPKLIASPLQHYPEMISLSRADKEI